MFERQIAFNIVILISKKIPKSFDKINFGIERQP
jgi:hypothetical protein